MHVLIFIFYFYEKPSNLENRILQTQLQCVCVCMLCCCVCCVVVVVCVCVCVCVCVLTEAVDADVAVFLTRIIVTCMLQDHERKIHDFVRLQWRMLPDIPVQSTSTNCDVLYDSTTLWYEGLLDVCPLAQGERSIRTALRLSVTSLSR